MNFYPTPALLLDFDLLTANCSRMAATVAQHGVQLRPHVKTHKMIEVARLQLSLGAAGFTCAKLGEAEALLPAFEGHEGRREFFVAHSLVAPEAADRLCALRDNLDDLVLAVTSLAHLPALERVVARTGRRFRVMMAIDTGLSREGARGAQAALELARKVEASPQLELKGLYTHEGHFYGVAPEDASATMEAWYQRVGDLRLAAESAVGHKLLLWPGCSVTAAREAVLPGIDAVRPGAYVFGDLSLCESTQVMKPAEVAVHVASTVVDKPEPGLALLDVGSKTLSSDKSAAGLSARCVEFNELVVKRANEEHGYLTGVGVDNLEVGQVLQLIPAHICTVINLADEVMVVRAGELVDRWRVAARGKVN